HVTQAVVAATLAGHADLESVRLHVGRAERVESRSPADHYPGSFPYRDLAIATMNALNNATAAVAAVYAHDPPTVKIMGDDILELATRNLDWYADQLAMNSLGHPEPTREPVADGPPRSRAEIAEQAAVSPGVVQGLERAGALSAREVAADAPFAAPDPDAGALKLSQAQGLAAEDLVSKVAAQKYSATLLEGVTGSGKTEVYFEAVAQALRQGRESLVLVPEIALTSQWLERFERRFGVRPAEWHSDLGRRERRRVWRAVAEGGAPVVIGARSALFLPFANLGLIVVDEEHDSSFKQEEGVIYNARDMAVVRARDAGAAIALVSATPSLETVVNADTGRFGRVMLPDRHGGAELPRVELLDMRADPPAANHWLSPVLEREIVRTLESDKQSLLFLNRRGYAPLTLCRACGHRLECPNCQAWLVEHRHIRRLQCHHCDHTSPLPTVCPACGAEDKLAACGPGVERLAEEVRALVPTARLVVMASDTIPGPREAAELLRRVRDHEVDILIGTQVVAKGHHFPLLTLVGVVDADLGLAGGDLRAAERTYQLLWQVAGRAGREAHAGQVYLQTYMPDHEVMQGLASGDRGRFLESEQESRRLQGMPPFGRLAALIVSGEDDRAVRVAAQALGQSAPRGEKVQVLGPAPAPFALLRGRHRQRLLLKAGRGVNVQTLLRQWIAATTLPRRVRVQIDVDPYSFM
ncbi:MAG: primosomal protein N', partial [Proteobacteria bacterium]|nr:primosomal protein N' [Pseudomonadota bacterium]